MFEHRCLVLRLFRKYCLSPNATIIIAEGEAGDSVRACMRVACSTLNFASAKNSKSKHKQYF